MDETAEPTPATEARYLPGAPVDQLGDVGAGNRCPVPEVEWSSKSVLAAIAHLERRHGRWPTQKDFRSDLGPPGYATLWRRFGSIGAALELADSKGNKRSRMADESGDT